MVLTYSPDGKLVACGVGHRDLVRGRHDKEDRADAWGWSGWRRVRALSLDGRALASAIATPPATTRARKIRRFQGGAMGIAIAPDGRRLVSGGQDKAVAVWDISMAARSSAWPPTRRLTAAAYAPHGRTIRVGG